MGSATRYTLRRNTASRPIIKIFLILLLGFFYNKLIDFRENLLRNASVCTDFGAMTEILVGSESNALVSPIIIMACFLAGRLIISNIGLANHVRFTGKVST